METLIRTKLKKPETKAAPLPQPVEGWYADPEPSAETPLPSQAPHHVVFQVHQRYSTNELERNVPYAKALFDKYFTVLYLTQANASVI